MGLFSLYGQRFPRHGPISKIAIFGHKYWPLAKVPDVALLLSFSPRGSKLSLILLYRQQCARYRPIFKIAIFWHDTWPLANVPEDVHTHCLRHGVEIELIFAVQAAVSAIRPNFKIAIFTYNTWPLTKGPEVAHILSFKFSLLRHLFEFLKNKTDFPMF